MINIPSGYKHVLLVAIMQYVVAAILAAMVLDFGQLARACGAAILAHITSSAVLCSRRPAASTLWDQRFISWGFPFVLVIVISCATWAGWWSEAAARHYYSGRGYQRTDRHIVDDRGEGERDRHNPCTESPMKCDSQ